MCLMVKGLVLAMETDVCRDISYAPNTWTVEMLYDAAKRINAAPGQACVRMIEELIKFDSNQAPATT